MHPRSIGDVLGMWALAAVVLAAIIPLILVFAWAAVQVLAPVMPS